jgi:phosphopantetheinyl transferase (holo-ACP synthase)
MGNKTSNEMERKEHTILLTLLNVTKEVKEDSEATEIQRLVKNEVLLECCFAQTFLDSSEEGQPTIDAEEKQKMQHQVLRFIQVKDKYMALGSTLLKSQAFHSVHNHKPLSSARHRRRLLPVELPRTEYKKPYIPIKIGTKVPKKEEDVYPLSISHQFPIVGAAQLDTGVGTDTILARPYVGMDIVMFDDYNRRLFSSVDEFISVFRTSFTEWEWTRIHARNGSHLHEFYLRWAMKEAYTKAIGVGMGLAFDSFDTRLSLLDDDDVQEKGLWPALSACPKGKYVFGSVIHEDKKSEAWDFFFYPLYEERREENEHLIAPAHGCVCICVGSFPVKETNGDTTTFRTKVEWTKLCDLIERHK